MTGRRDCVCSPNRCAPGAFGSLYFFGSSRMQSFRISEAEDFDIYKIFIRKLPPGLCKEGLPMV